MTARDIIVIGASNGGDEALLELVAGLPTGLAAAIMVVIHSAAGGTNQWPQLLERTGKLPAIHATDGAAIELGKIYVAPPSFHLLIKKGHLQLTRGPRENHFRPAIDPLFRTAARAYGARVVGVILSGRLNDGTNGLLRIKRLGGTAVIQSPEDALVPQMPLSALQNVNVDFVLPVAQMPVLLTKLVRESVVDEMQPVYDESEVDVAEHGDWALQTHKFSGAPSSLTCPECGGTLWQVDEENLIRFRCHLGHAFTAEGLLDQQDERVEASLWTALRDLEEAAEFRRRMALRAREGGMSRLTQEHDLQVHEFEVRASVIRGLLLREDAKRPS